MSYLVHFLLSVLLFLFVLYALAVTGRLLYCRFFGDSTQETNSAKWVNAWLVKILTILFQKEVPEFNPAQYPAFINDCRAALLNVCDNPQKCIPCDFAPEFTQQGIPAIRFQVFSLAQTPALDAAALTLENSAATWLSMTFGATRFTLDVHYDQCGTGYYYYYLLFASAPDNSKRLLAYIANKVTVANQRVADQNAPVVSKKLEQAMQQAAQQNEDASGV